MGAKFDIDMLLTIDDTGMPVPPNTRQLIDRDIRELYTRDKTKDKSRKFDFSLLSRREIEVARLAAKGYTNAQIAECLYISAETVKSHMNSIFEKLNISSRKELMEN